MKLFPDCTIATMEQRSPEWFQVRRGKLTGSKMGMWLSERPSIAWTIPEIRDQIKEIMGEAPPLKWNKAELVAESERLGIILPTKLTKENQRARLRSIASVRASVSEYGEPDFLDVDIDIEPRSSSLYPIWKGLVYEEEARQRFEAETGYKVDEVGFCTSKHGWSGVSPDGLIFNRNEGLEIKCPMGETHELYCEMGGVPDKYKAQVYGSMAVTGAAGWHFVSYCPGSIEEFFHVYIERDETVERMAEGLKEFAEEVGPRIKELIAKKLNHHA